MMRELKAETIQNKATSYQSMYKSDPKMQNDLTQDS